MKGPTFSLADANRGMAFVPPYVQLLYCSCCRNAAFLLSSEPLDIRHDGVVAEHDLQPGLHAELSLSSM